MSFEELMAHASEIKFLAIKRALEEHETEPEYARQGVDGYYSKWSNRCSNLSRASPIRPATSR
jgi:hypothetical protein